MPPPKVIGPSQRVPGAYDVETERGVFPMTRDALVLNGLGSALRGGDSAVEAMRPAPGPQTADATVSIGDVSVSPVAPEAPARTRGDAMAAAQMSGAQQAVRGVLDAATGSGASRVLDMATDRLAATSQATDAAGQRQAAQQREAAPQADAAAEGVAQSQAQAQAQYAALEGAAMRGDQQAVYDLFRRAQQGDVDAAQALDRARAFQRPSGGGGSRDRLTRTETTTLQVPARDATPEEAAALRDAQMRQDQAERDALVAMGREVEAEASALTDTADAITRAQAEVDQLERQRQAAERARQAELRRRQAELDRAAGEVASKQIDPSRMFARGETRNRLAAAVGLALGGLADALRGGGDSGIRSALTVINQAVDRDIEAQRSNVGIAQQGVAQKRALLDDMRRTLGDEAAAEDATRALMLEGVERDIRALQLAATSDAQRAGLDRLLAEIQQQKAAARQSAIMQGIGTTDIVVERRQQIGGGGGGRRVVIPDTPEAGAPAAERQAIAEAEAAARADIEDADRALALLDSTIQVGRFAGSALGEDGVLSSLRSSDARELDEVLGRLARTPTAEAFGAANPEQMRMIQQQEGLTRDRSPEQIRAAIERRRRLAQARIEAARVGAGREAVREVQQRRPEERAGTQREVGDAAAALGGTRVR